MKNVYAFKLVAKIVGFLTGSLVRLKQILKTALFRGEKSFATKNLRHIQNHRKGGEKMVLDIEDLLLLTLMRLRVGTPEFDLAFTFQLPQFLFQEH